MWGGLTGANTNPPRGGGGRAGVWGGVLVVIHGHTLETIDPLHPYKARTEHVGFSPPRQTFLERPKKTS